MSLLENLFGSTIRDELFHYTSPQGLLGIVQSKSVWATNISFLNDASEVRHGFTMLRAEIKRLTPKLGSVAKRFLSDVTEVAGRQEMYLNANLFIFSLSERGDLLSQWRGYCPSSGGFSLGFTSRSLGPMLSRPQIRIARCIYDKREQRRILTQFLSEKVVECAAQYQPTNDAASLYSQMSSMFFDDFFRVAVLLKDQSFKEEREWRIAYHVREMRHIDDITNNAARHNLKINYRARGSLIVPYVELPLTDENQSAHLDKVIVGPSRHPNLSFHSLNSLQNSLPPTMSIGAICNSSIPLREL